MDQMAWHKAKEIIEQNIVKGTDLNTKRSKLRKVVQVNHPCTRYYHDGENGFLVSISKHNHGNLEIPWSMLEKCFSALNEQNGRFSGVITRSRQKTIPVMFMSWE